MCRWVMRHWRENRKQVLFGETIQQDVGDGAQDGTQYSTQDVKVTQDSARVDDSKQKMDDTQDDKSA